MSDMDLVEFMTARLDEREALARAASAEGAGWSYSPGGGVWSDGPEADPVFPVVYDEGRPLPEQGRHIAANDPAHVLREVAAMRAIVADTVQVPTISARRMVKHLATIWAEHADYRAEWTP